MLVCAVFCELAITLGWFWLFFVRKEKCAQTIKADAGVSGGEIGLGQRMQRSSTYAGRL